VLSILKQHLFHHSFFFEGPQTHYVEISILQFTEIFRNFTEISIFWPHFETIFLLYARKTILGTFFTYSMTLLYKTWSKKSIGVGFRAIQHTQCSFGTM
jgi:hypothetical protein